MDNKPNVPATTVSTSPTVAKQEVAVVKEKRTEQRAFIFAVPIEFAIPRAGMISNPNEAYVGENRRYAPSLMGMQSMRVIDIYSERKIPDFARLVGTSPESMNWDEKAVEYWDNYTASIPFGITKTLRTGEVIIEGGKTINGSFVERDGNIYPDVIEEYVLYTSLMKESDEKVAKDPALYLEDGGAIFFCVSVEEEKKRKDDIYESTAAITIQLAKLYSNSEDHPVEQLRNILIVSDTTLDAIDINRMDKKEVLTNLAAFAQENSKKFLAVVEDKDLNHKSFIAQLTQSNILTKSGGSYYYDGDLWGSLGDVIQRLKSTSAIQLDEQLRQKLTAFQSIRPVDA